MSIYKDESSVELEQIKKNNNNISNRLSEIIYKPND